MTEAVPLEEAITRYRWTPEGFLRAFDAGAFGSDRIELLDGEVVPVSIGRWHGKTTALVIKRLPEERVEVTSATLPSGNSLPDPDVFVAKGGAEPREYVSRSIAAWDPENILLVVEVSETSVALDLGFKAQLYGQAGYPEYWVITQDSVYVHRQPSRGGYQHRTTLLPGDQLPVPYAPEIALDVAELIGA